jgi:hypothetical protein
MEKDKLEQYISEHRQGFDEEEIPEGLWGKIDKDLNKPVRLRKIISVSWKIAAAILLFVTSYFFNYYLSSNKHYTGQMAYSGENIVFFKKQALSVNHITYTSIPVKNTIMIETNATLSKKTETPQDSASIEFEKLNAYYASRIEQKKKEIFFFTANNPKIEKDITIEFGQLDSAYKALRNDLKDNVDNSEVVSAMIQNYRIRLEILENILEQLKKVENHETKNKQHEI